MILLIKKQEVLESSVESGKSEMDGSEKSLGALKLFSLNKICGKEGLALSISEISKSSKPLYSNSLIDCFQNF